MSAPPAPPPGDAPAERLARLLDGATSLEARFDRFAHWLESETRATAVFVANAEGLPMVESKARDAYVVAAGGLGVLFEQLHSLLPDVEEAHTSFSLKSQGTVELVGCQSALGRFTVGLVLEEPLAAGFSTRIRSAFQSLISPEKSETK